MRPICLAALVGAVAAMTGTAAPGATLAGSWGGPGGNLTIDAAGGRLEQDCATGNFGPVRIGKNGRFKAAGRFEAHQPGPQRADEPGTPAGAPASFEGMVKGDTMRLTIRTADGAPQTLNLLKGKRAKLIRCY